MAKKKPDDRMTPSEIIKIGKHVTRLALNSQKIRERREREEYNKRVQKEIIEPVKQAAEKAFKLHGLGKPKIVVLVPENETKPKIDIKKIAKGLGAEIITDPKRIAEMKKKAHPLRPK